MSCRAPGCLALILVIAACGRVGFGGPSSSAGDAAGATDVAKSNDAATTSAIAFLQCAGGSSADGTTPSVPFHIPVRAGDLLLLAFDYDNESATPNEPTDTVGTAYTVITGAGANFLAYGLAPSAGANTASATLTDMSGSYYELRVCEFAGIVATDPYDVGAVSSGAGSGVDVAVSASFTTMSPNELIFSFEDGSPTALPGTGYTEASNFDQDESEYAIAATPGTYESRTTLATDGTWAVVVATFRGTFE